MKLDTNTIEILKNFSTINPNLVVKANEPIATISDAKNIYASTSETFSEGFGIYNLNEFLNVIDLLGEDSDFEFGDKSVKIKNGRSNANYRFADPNILTYPQKAISIPNVDLTLDISADMLQKLRKAASVLAQGSLSFIGENGRVSARVVDPKNSASNSFELELDSDNDCKATFEFHVQISNLKMMSGDYELGLSSKFVSRWTHKTKPVVYYISLEKNSTFNA
jgi:hypothetical protein